MERLGAQEGEVITHPLVTRSIGSAQKRVEGQNFEARKRLLEYDDVMNQQREVIYDRRLFALEGGEDLKGEVWEMIEHAVRGQVDEFVPEGARGEDWDLAGLRNRLMLDYFVAIDELPRENTPEPGFDDRDDVAELVTTRVHEAFRRKLTTWGDHLEGILSFIMLSMIDQKWRDHLYDLDHLKASIGFRGWGQKDPLIEYKQEAYSMFVELMSDLRKTVASMTFRTQIAPPQPRIQAPRRLTLSGPGEPGGAPTGAAAAPRPQAQPPEKADALAAAFAGSRRVGATVGSGALAEPEVSRLQTNRGDEAEATREPVRVEAKVGRNDPCPCGSGRKYKKCHGAGAT
jgi:preprotein translocase subunit SecA